MDRSAGERARERTSDAYLDIAPRPRLFIAAVAPLSRFWHMRGHLREGRRWLEQALEGPSAPATVPLLRIASRLSGIAYAQGDLEAARHAAERGLALAQEVHDERGLMLCTETLALCAMEAGEYSVSRSYFEENLERSQALRDERGTALTKANMAVLAMRQHDYRAGAMLSSESLELYRRLSDKEGMAASLIALGVSELLARETGRAERRLRQGLQLALEIGQRELAGSALGGLGAVAVHDGDPRRGAVLLGAASRARRETGVALDAIELTLLGDAIQEMHRLLPREELDGLMAKGNSLSLDEVLRAFPQHMSSSEPLRDD